MQDHGIFNFRAIDARLATAGQPTAGQFRALAADGCRAVLNLHMNDPRWALQEEEALLAELGVAYRHVPVVFDAPQPADYEALEAALDALAGVPTLVHCVANYRVSCFMALYGERRLGWSREQADAFVASVWEPDDTWRGFLAAQRARP